MYLQGHVALPEEAAVARSRARGGVHRDAGLLEEAAEPRGVPALCPVPEDLQDLLQQAQRQVEPEFCEYLLRGVNNF